MDKVKKLIVAASTLALLAGPYGMTLPAFGSAGCSNKGADDHSGQSCEAHDDDIFSKSNSNSMIDAFVIDVRIANNGFNDQNDNEDENEMAVDETDAESSTAGFVAVNETEFESGGASADASNEDANVHSSQSAGATDDDTASVGNSNNDVYVDGVNAAVANNGVNDQNGNEDKNKMTVRDTSASAFSGFAIGSNYTSIKTGGSSTASNKTADDHSGQSASSSDDDTVGVSNSNNMVDGIVVNAAVANNGLNDQNDNEDENEMLVEDSSADATSEVFLGVNETEVETGGSSAEASNEGATDHSSQSSSSSDDDTASIANSNNDLYAETTNVAVANGGGNDQNGNEDKNKMTIGKAKASGTTMVIIGANQSKISE